MDLKKHKNNVKVILLIIGGLILVFFQPKNWSDFGQPFVNFLGRLKLSTLLHGYKKLDNLASLVAAQFEDFVVMIFKKDFDFF